MSTPPILKVGDTIGIIAPAYSPENTEWQAIIPILRSWGLKTKLGNSMHLRNGIFAGSDSQRAEDLVAMLCDPEVKAIICVRGGYGCIKLLPILDAYDKTQFMHKWIIGYSDVTVLLSYMYQWHGWNTIHGCMPIDLSMEQTIETNKSWEYMRELLMQAELPTYTLSPNVLNRYGEVSATVVGGNLSVIYSMCGTPYHLDTDGCILFIEDIGEKAYHLDRMMMNLKLSCMLSNLKGLIVGSFSNISDEESFGLSPYQIVASHVKDYNYPVVFGFPAGHQQANFPIIIGSNVKLKVHENKVIVSHKIL